MNGAFPHGLEPQEAALGALLLQANRDRTLIEQVPDHLLPRDEASAYRVAASVADRLGARVGGWKIGATAANNSRDLGAARPIVGRIAAANILLSPARLPFDRLMTPVQECEFAFELAEDLAARAIPWTPADLVPRIRAAYPAIEVGERRLSRRHAVPILMLVADNSAAGHLVLGDPIENWQSRDLAACPVTLRIDDAPTASGFGRDVLGHPLAALAWMANQGALAGRTLKAGDIVSTGSCTGMVAVARATRSVADFGPLGTVDVSFA